MRHFSWTKRPGFFALLFLILFQIENAGAIPVPVNVPSRVNQIRVRLAEAVPKVSVRGFDLRIYDSGKNQRRLAAAADRVSSWDLRCQDGRIRAIAIQGGHAGKTLDLAEPVTIGTPAGFVSFGDRPYRENLVVYSVGSLCEVVNELDIEKYLDGLVNAEFSSKWSEQAVAAQVVAARTYALYQIRQAKLNGSSHFDVDATVRDQVYDGYVREDFRASRTVEKTKGLVLVAAQGAPREPLPLKAFYHSTCGGKTELPEQVWGSRYPGFRRSVSCPYCAASPRFHWSLDLESKELANLLLRGADIAASEKRLPRWPSEWRKALSRAKLLELRIGKANDGGRVVELISVWAGTGNQKVQLPIPGARFREWVGPAKLRSTAFRLSMHRAARETRWHFDGRGNGHGVGLCQWGAKVMGERGHTMISILKHYYPDARLQRFW